MADLFGKRIDESYIYVLNSTPGTNIVTNGDNTPVDWNANGIVLNTGSQDIDGQKNFLTVPHVNGLEVLFKNNNLSGVGEAFNSLVTQNSVGAAIFLGENNLLSGRYSVILAGRLNKLTGNQSIIGAGRGNSMDDVISSFIGAGTGNSLVDTKNSSILVGRENDIISSNEAAIVAGRENLINQGVDGVIAGGTNNEVRAAKGFVGGGDSNKS